MDPSITIREFKLSDLNACIDLVKTVWPTRTEIFTEDAVFYTEAKFYFDLYFLVAEHDGKIVGMGLTTLSLMASDMQELQWVMVHPKYRDMGIGQEIVKMCLERSRNAGKSLLLITSIPDFYRKLSFTNISEYGPGRYLIVDNLPAGSTVEQ